MQKLEDKYKELTDELEDLNYQIQEDQQLIKLKENNL